MQLGMIGLGRMGASMVRRLLRDGHACVVHDLQPSAVAGLVKDGATGVESLKEMVSQLGQPRTIWLMVPAAVVDQALGDLVPLLGAGDIVIDGGNSYYCDDMRRGTQLQALGACRTVNLPEIVDVWRRGSVIGSCLRDLTATALLTDPELAGYGGRGSDSGEGRWTIQAAIDEGVPAPVLSAALYSRFTSRGSAEFSNRILSAMRREIGGHVEKPAP